MPALSVSLSRSAHIYVVCVYTNHRFPTLLWSRQSAAARVSHSSLPRCAHYRLQSGSCCSTTGLCVRAARALLRLSLPISYPGPCERQRRGTFFPARLAWRKGIAAISPIEAADNRLAPGDKAGPLHRLVFPASRHVRPTWRETRQETIGAHGIQTNASMKALETTHDWPRRKGEMFHMQRTRLPTSVLAGARNRSLFAYSNPSA